jgi:katanin p60 ATPase-containing subunit A1
VFGRCNKNSALVKLKPEARQSKQYIIIKKLEDRTQQRSKGLLVLIMDHLQSTGYIRSLEQLQLESGLSLKKITVADNIDLMTVLHEFQSYFEIKFGKQPKLTRKTKPDDLSKKHIPPQSVDYSIDSFMKGELEKSTRPVIPSIKKEPKEPKEYKSESIEAVGYKTGSAADQKYPPAAEPTQVSDELKFLRPMPIYENADLRELASIITRDIFVKNPDVKWSSIAGLEKSKKLIKEAIVFPIKYPSLFTGLLKPWKGILLYGPPGTGKTMLAKAIATECNTTFFNISASSVVSKWRGDSEKLIRVLFELARHHAPSTIFLDELESIMGHRSAGGEHEGSRRMKTELLIQV